MADLSTTYMGLQLKNPLIVGASNLVMKPETIKLLEEAGVAAVVYKSLFEEQVQLESLQLSEEMSEYENRFAEMSRLFPNIEHAGPKEHLMKLKKLKESLSIPVIGSLNAIYDSTWVDYAVEMEKSGIDALELNLYATPGYFEVTGKYLEDKQLETIKAVKQAVSIPVSVKISPFYTNTLNFIKQVDEAGADAFVLFNRFYQPEIDPEKEEFYYPWELTQPNDHKLSLRYAGLLYGNLDGNICIGRGLYTTEDVLGALLAGADTVQLVSTIYKNQPSVVKEILTGIEKWMEKKGYATLADFRGNLSRKKLKDPFVYQRAQYVDILAKSDSIFKKYPMI